MSIVPVNRPEPPQGDIIDNCYHGFFAGIDLGPVTDVVLPHMHIDHVGGLLVSCVKQQLCPDQCIHTAAPEIHFWAAPDFSHTEMPSPVLEVVYSMAKRALNEYQPTACLRGRVGGSTWAETVPHW